MSSAGATLGDWLARLETFSPREIDLGLERVAAVLERLALPRPELVLHVAGTNGKGSSVAMAAALLASDGSVVGTYTSPHVSRYNERIRVGGEEASDAEIVAAFERVDAARGDTPLTYFEFGTVAALIVFAAREVDVAVLEIGMGGRLDAVNAVAADAGLITNVSLDHCDWLGDDIETIAREKAGIMRAGKPVVFAAHERPVSIEQVSSETGAELIAAGRDYDWLAGQSGWSWQGRTLNLEALAPPPLKGEFQVGNAAGVLALLEAAGRTKLLDTRKVNRAFRGLSLAGRMQHIDGDRHWLLDVAHNAAAAEVLARQLDQDRIDGSTVAIVGTLDDKDVEGIVRPLVPEVDHWIAVEVDSPRAIAVDELARRIANAANTGCLEAESIDAAVTRARELTGETDRVLVTGSFYLVGPALEALAP